VLACYLLRAALDGIGALSNDRAASGPGGETHLINQVQLEFAGSNGTPKIG